jgi:hypothetical protein
MIRQAPVAGFTLIELIAAMTASTVLLVALTATITMSSRLLEMPLADGPQWHDREIADRLAADLRYATSIHDTHEYGFRITKPAISAGVREHAVYDASVNGLTRQVDNGPVINLDAEPPSGQWMVDGYTAPTYVASANVARVRSVNATATGGTDYSLQVDLPPGCQDGDLLLLAVAALSPWYTDVSPNNWNFLAFRYINGLQMVVMYQIYSAATASPVTILAFPDSAMAAAIVCVENVDVSDPIRWHASNSGYSWSASPNTHPAALEATEYETNQLNVQVFAAIGDPWHAGTLGLASFTDVARETAAAGLTANQTSIAITVRNGATPKLTTTPRVWHQEDGSWGQIALQVGAAP